ncbi:MAG: CBS domain-containing protein [Clostridiales bacterium GWF2_38_85]|nr:MAG: CBS domain-containing protein [Clostridiales bacterium GWF2_38_85]HBL84004.1 CBS domain-containing protein [Clostridiales bacterium]
MQIQDKMTKNVVSIEPQETIGKAAQLMREYNIGSLPVCEGQNVVGIITDRDIALRCVAEGKNNVSVKDVMTSEPITIESEKNIHEAANLMSSRQIRRLPVVENNNLVGMISLGDIAVEPNLTNKAGAALKDISTPSVPEQPYI